MSRKIILGILVGILLGRIDLFELREDMILIIPYLLVGVGKMNHEIYY